MSWLDWLGVAGGAVLAGYIAWGVMRLKSMRWPEDLDRDVGE